MATPQTKKPTLEDANSAMSDIGRRWVEMRICPVRVLERMGIRTYLGYNYRDQFANSPISGRRATGPYAPQRRVGY